MAGDAHGLGSKERANERLLWLGFSLAPFCNSNDRFKKNMEFIRFKNWMPKVVFNFRRGGSISQRRGFFAAKGHFCSPFHNCEMGVLCCEMALVCQRGVSQLQNTLRNGALAAKMGFLTLWGFRSHFAAAKRGHYAAKWHSCAKRWFRNCENHFAAEWQFCNEGLISQRTFWGCKIISQQRGDFAGASFRLRNFTDQYFSLAFKFLLAPSDLPSISLQFLLHEIIQKD